MTTGSDEDVSRGTSDDGTFSLERTENPHPRMLAEAWAHRKRAAWWRPRAKYGWRCYRAAMCAATGETPEAIDAWMDRHP